MEKCHRTRGWLEEIGKDRKEINNRLWNRGFRHSQGECIEEIVEIYILYIIYTHI